MKKETSRYPVIMQVADQIGSRKIIGSSVVKSIQALRRVAHLWVLDDEVIVVEEIHRAFKGFACFKGEKRKQAAKSYAKNFLTNSDVAEV
jgi:hypothetical protein